VTRAIEAIMQARYEAGRVAAQSLDQTRVARLSAEIQLVEALAGTSSVPEFGRSIAEEYGGLDPLDAAHDRARALEGLRRVDLPRLRRERRETAAQEAVTRLREFHVGRGTLDELLKSFRNLAEAELALATAKPERVAARERLWQTALHIEAVNQRRFDSGRIAQSDLLQTRLVRWTAEIQLRRELAGP
jgi:outer membrane protein TolC